MMPLVRLVVTSCCRIIPVCAGQTDVVGELLAAPAVLGQVRKVRGGKFVG